MALANIVTGAMLPKGGLAGPCVERHAVLTDWGP